MSKPTRSGVATLAVLSLIWGYTWIVQKEGLRFASPLDYAVLRALPGALVLFGAMTVLRRPLSPPHLGYALLLGLFQTTAMLGFTNGALIAGGAGRSAILCYTMPFWTLLFARFVLGERLRALQWGAVALAGVGLVLVLEPWHMTGTIASKAMAVAGGMSWAAATVVAKYWRAREDYDLLSVTAWQMLLGGLVLAAIAWVVPSHPIRWTPYFGLLVAYIVVLSTAIAWFLWLYLLNRLPASIAGLSIMAVPVLGTFFSWLQLGEQPSRVELVGIVIIAASLALLTWAGKD
ncbi:MAG: EamA family transporter [Proteobacteria bacterium]|nr:EamA family transporter [Pseudomonadota bacterium]